MEQLATDPRRARTVGLLMLVGASVLWSLSGLAVKITRIDPVAFAFYRCLAAGAPMLLIAPFSKGRWPAPRPMALSAVIYTAVVTLLIISMTRGTAATGILLQYTSPIFCALFAWLFQRRAIGGQTLAAMLIGALGIGIMIFTGPPGRGWISPVSGLLSGIAFAALILLLERMGRGGATNLFAIVLFNNLGAALILLPICLAMDVLNIGLGAWTIVAATGVIQLALPYVLFQLALRRVHAVDASLLILLEPVLNPLWVALVTDERPDGGTIVGGIAILVAMVIEALKKPSQGEE